MSETSAAVDATAREQALHDLADVAHRFYLASVRRAGGGPPFAHDLGKLTIQLQRESLRVCETLEYSPSHTHSIRDQIANITNIGLEILLAIGECNLEPADPDSAPPIGPRLVKP